MIKSLFKKTFDIRDGEIRISFFMQLYIFLLITVLLMVKPTINALFLSKLGAVNLPYAYILVAIVAIVSMFFYSRGVKRYSLRVLTVLTLIFFSVIFFTLAVLMHFDLLNEWMLFAYYLSVSLFAVLVTSQFWVIANMVYNAREAKRLFGFIGAGAIAGGIFGGYLTSIIAPVLGNKIVIAVAAAMILICIPIVYGVWKIRIRRLNNYVRSQRRTQDQSTYTSPFKLIIRSRHLTYLAAIVGVGVIMAKLVDFQFSDFANRAIPDSDELASFFGFWFSSFNVIALLIQLFLTNRLLAWLGVTTNLLILPLGVAIGCLLFLTFPELWVLILIKGMDGSFKQSINKAGIELSILPIPTHIKNEAKSFIDVVVDSVATGLSGLMLIFIIQRLELSTSYITVIILLFLFIWIVLIYKLREEYFESFRTNIQSSISSEETSNKKSKSKSTTQSAIEVLTNGDEKAIIALLDRLQDFRLNALEPYIVNLLGHPSTAVKLAVIEQLYQYKKGTAFEEIQKLIEIKDDELVYKAMDYLLNHTYLVEEKVFDTYLNHSVDYISNAALLCLAKEAEANKKLAIQYDLDKRIEDKIEELFSEDNDLRKTEIAELLLTIAYAKDPKYYSFISVQFNNKDEYIVAHAIQAAGITAHEAFVAPLLNFLSEKIFRKHATQALRSYGVEITQTILKMDMSENLSDDVKPHLPKVIQSFKSRQAVKVLIRLLKSKDFTIRLEAAKSLNRLKAREGSLPMDQRKLTKIVLQESSYYRTTLNCMATQRDLLSDPVHIGEQDTDREVDLEIAREHLLELLEKQLDQSLEAIFKLLSLKYNQSDIDTAYYGLKSEVKDTKINAIEFLDNLLQSKLKNAMLPLIEYHVIDNYEYSISSFKVRTLTEKQMLLVLLKYRGAKMKMAVLHTIRALDDRSYLKVVIPLQKHKNRKIRELAQVTVETLQD
ncbi:MAG: MFS transporter [Flavobacteriaceae bacterium]|nr:MFS transporter [Flavobacteriaceae bacterium]